jgi:hypothetical protein
MTILVLHAILAYVGEAQTILIFRSPGVVEAISEAIRAFNSSLDTS